MKIKAKSIELIAFALIFYELSIYSHMIFLILKYIVLVFVLIANVKYIKRISSAVWGAIAYAGVVGVSSIINHMSLPTIIASFAFGLFLFDMYLEVYAQIIDNGMHNLVKILLCVFGTMVIVNDILLFLVRYDFENPAELYLVGNKFGVSYLHIFVYTLLLSWKEIKKLSSRFWVILVGFGIASISCCTLVKCTTGIVGMSFIMILSILPGILMKIFTKPYVLIAGWMGINYLIFGSYALFTNPKIENFIVNVLHKSSNMTGRLRIYTGIFEIIKQKPLLGYGYYSSIVNKYLLGNAQNGILKIVIDAGIIGLVCYLILVYQTYKKADKNYESAHAYIALIVCMSLCSMVEICLTEHIVFLTYSIIFAISSFNSEENIKKYS